jgi:hypothetical protein
MERTVPTTESEEIELYLRTYYSLLRTTTEVRIRTLEEVHAGMKSLLHPGARDPKPDMPAFIYSLLRLPKCIIDIQWVVMGQSPDVFERAGFGDVTAWQEVAAPARRRRCYYDGKATLACFIASRSDIDDLIPVLTAFQIEWNKLHQLLKRLPPEISLQDIAEDLDSYTKLDEMLGTSEEDIERLYAIWGDEFGHNLVHLATEPRNLRVQLLSGSLSEYRRATHTWWDHIEERFPEINQRPVYFISSNPHSLVNVLSGHALRKVDELVDFLRQPGNSGLLNEWKDIQTGASASSRENFLYYVWKKYLQSPAGATSATQQAASEQALGILRVPSPRSFDVEAQVIDLSRLNPAFLDPRLSRQFDLGKFVRNRAVILNIDYPLGMAAYNILTEVSEHVGKILGVYVMGKAASLNAAVGDVMIPGVVHDEQSQNTYIFQNCFTATDVSPFMIYGSVLDNQKALTVKGTFLQTSRYMDVFYREGYTDIEMEAGPYLSAIFEMHRPNRHPINELVNLYNLPFDLGVLHYASDAPLNKSRNLGAGSLSYFGMDATYATTLAILNRIFAN